MAKTTLMLVLFAAVCLLAGVASGRFAGEPFLVKGYAYCDTCRCGYETDATNYVANATVRIECRDRNNYALTYTKKGKTNSKGRYKIIVESDRGDDPCDVVLVNSPDPECPTPNQGRDRTRVILTRNNGLNTNVRHANAMGFLKTKPLANCEQILMKYKDPEEY